MTTEFSQAKFVRVPVGHGQVVATTCVRCCKAVAYSTDPHMLQIAEYAHACRKIAGHQGTVVHPAESLRAA